MAEIGEEGESDPQSLGDILSELFWDKDGQLLTIKEWGEKRSGPDAEKYCVIGKDKVDFLGEEVEVSTVWVGMDLTLGDGPPDIFETMIFGGPFEDDDEPFGSPCTRYATEEEARAGHLRTVAALIQGKIPWFMNEQGA